MLSVSLIVIRSHYNCTDISNVFKLKLTTKVCVKMKAVINDFGILNVDTSSQYYLVFICVNVFDHTMASAFFYNKGVVPTTQNNDVLTCAGMNNIIQCTHIDNIVSVRPPNTINFMSVACLREQLQL